jgi:hypothetical protein
MENQLVTFEIFKKKSKKTKVYFKIVGQNRIQKFEVTHPKKSANKNGVKTEKKKTVRFFSKTSRFFISLLWRCFALVPFISSRG